MGEGGHTVERKSGKDGGDKAEIPGRNGRRVGLGFGARRTPTRASGSRAPTTVSQQVFVKVVRGKLPAITPHEQAYLKFLKVIQSFGERSNPQAAAAVQPREAQRLSPEPEVGKAHQDPQPGPESPRAPADSPFAPLPPQEPPKMVGPASLKEVLGFDPYSEEPPRVYDASHPSDEESAGPSQGWYSREDYKKFHQRYP